MVLVIGGGGHGEGIEGGKTGGAECGVCVKGGDDGDSGDGDVGGYSSNGGELGGPSAKLSKDVCLVEEENDAGVQKHFAVRHHVEQLMK